MKAWFDLILCADSSMGWQLLGKMKQPRTGVPCCFWVICVVLWSTSGC
jgi:hypothetical protein